MSWADLVNNNLVGSGNVSKAAICGFDGSIWGKSDNFKITTEEAAAAGRGFANKDGLLGTGLKFEGEKYFVLNADGDRVIGKKGSQGFFIYKTGQAVIISIYEGGVQPEACSKTTGALADYFKSINY
uniref:Profilin n=1 Tax=Haemonchus contortus TaxID=6289 RepID=A0A7I4Y2Z2_HAECO